MTGKPVRRMLFAWAAMGVFCLGMLAGSARRSASIELGDIIGDAIKVGGVGVLISRFADELDEAINGLLGQRGIAVQGMTKVVPIIRVGTKGGTQVGGAQVVGPAQQVEKVKAVAEVQLNVGALRGRALIPIETRNPLQGDLSGVGGVGVSATIKVRI